MRRHPALDRYAAHNENFVRVVDPHGGPGARSAPGNTGNQAGAPVGISRAEPLPGLSFYTIPARGICEKCRHAHPGCPRNERTRRRRTAAPAVGGIGVEPHRRGIARRARARRRHRDCVGRRSVCRRLRSVRARHADSDDRGDAGSRGLADEALYRAGRHDSARTAQSVGHRASGRVHERLVSTSGCGDVRADCCRRPPGSAIVRAIRGQTTRRSWRRMLARSPTRTSCCPAAPSFPTPISATRWPAPCSESIGKRPYHRRPAVFRVDAARHEPVDHAPRRRDEAAACHGLSTRRPGARGDAARQRHANLAGGLSVDHRDRHVARAVRAHVEGPHEGSRRSLANGRGGVSRSHTPMPRTSSWAVTTAMA